MGITNSNKQISTDQIDCNGTLKITLALSAAPDIASNPTDIVLVLDRSGSLAGQPLADGEYEAKIRSAASPALCLAKAQPDGTVALVFPTPVRAPAPGQSAVGSSVQCTRSSDTQWLQLVRSLGG